MVVNVLDRMPRRMAVRAAPPEFTPLHLVRAPDDTHDVHLQGLSAGLAGEAARELDQLLAPPRRLSRRDVLHRQGEPFTALQVVRLGMLKTVLLAEGGREQVSGYHVGGDVIGLDAIGYDTHACDAIALEDSEVRSLPLDRLDELARREPTLLRTLFRLVSLELRRSHERALLLAGMCALERVATFLLDYAQRNRTRGYSASEFVLRLTREEMASFLGLKFETVSRAFSHLHAEGLIQVRGREVKLLDGAGLRRAAGQA